MSMRMRMRKVQCWRDVFSFFEHLWFLISLYIAKVFRFYRMRKLKIIRVISLNFRFHNTQHHVYDIYPLRNNKICLWLVSSAFRLHSLMYMIHLYSTIYFVFYFLYTERVKVSTYELHTIHIVCKEYPLRAKVRILMSADSCIRIHKLQNKYSYMHASSER